MKIILGRRIGSGDHILLMAEASIVKRMIGLLMMLGLVVSVVGCGDDDNPVSSNRDLLLGEWEDEYGESLTFNSDGTFLEDGESGKWSLVGDQLTYTFDDPDFGIYIEKLISVTNTELRTSDAEDESNIYIYTR